MLAFWPHVRDRRIASTRIRCFQVIDGLRSLDVDAGLYDGEGVARPEVLVLAKRYDAASLEQAVNLRRAIETDKIRLVYQPLVNSSGEKLIGVEALCRWSDALAAKSRPASSSRSPSTAD